MGLRIDMHVHTAQYSPCSQIDPDRLIKQAVRVGLQGLVITEHHYQWRDEELSALLERSGEMGFLLLAGFEYSTSAGDLLVFGLDATAVQHFPPGLMPSDAVCRVHELGGFCVAAHPTRAGMGFDESIFNLGIDAVEVASVNLRDHEQRLAMRIATAAELPNFVSSDAHRLPAVGRYAMEFQVPVRSIDDIVRALAARQFQPIGCSAIAELQA